MSPKSIEALRDFSAACRHSPEPARSVADLAELLAACAEADSVATTAEPAGTAAPAVSALVPDEPPFPPVAPTDLAATAGLPTTDTPAPAAA